MKPLQKLHVDGFDQEQIWQQLNVFNEPFIQNCVASVAELSAHTLPLTLKVLKENSAQQEIVPKTKSILKNQTESNGNVKKKSVKIVEEDDHDHRSGKQSKSKIDFFNFEEMEAFLNQEDKKEMLDQNEKLPNEENEEEIDYFAEIPSDDDEDDEGDDDLMYDDFFDAPPSKLLKSEAKSFHGSQDNGTDEEEVDDEENLEDFDFSDVEDEEDNDEVGDENGLNGFQPASDSSDNDDESNELNTKLKQLATESLLDPNSSTYFGKSPFEASQLRLQDRIAKAERELLLPSTAKWQLSGETSGEVRPENSLLEEHCQFDAVAKPPQMLTEETTKTIESMILQRIKDKAFDDVERKVKPNEQPFEFRRRIMLESEKSKVGLAEVYEKEYLKVTVEICFRMFTIFHFSNKKKILVKDPIPG